MKAVTYTRQGPSSVLAVNDREVPTPGPGEVRVRVAVSGVNPTDWKARAGGQGPAAFDEMVPNQDGAGVVDALGEGVTGLSLGERVWIFLAAHDRPTGTAQEYTVVPASRVAPLAADFATGASVGVPAMTAHRALTVHEAGPARLSPDALVGRTVLVAGGTGAVGHAAIQLARWAGATVIATVSSAEKAALARAAGAHHVLDRTTDDLAARIGEIAPAGVDHIVEVALGANAGLDTQVAANHASIAYFADDGGAAYSVPVVPSFAKNLRFQGLLLYTVGDGPLATAAADVSAAIADGALPVGEAAGLPLTWFPLEEAGAAHDAVEGGARGKVLIEVADL